MGTEKKANFGSMEATFGMQATIGGQSDFMFVTINRFRSPGKYRPVYKSECKTPSAGVFEWTTLTIDTDTLANADDHMEILFQIWLHKTNGNHKKVS